MVNGAMIDDIDYFNRVSEMLHVLTSKANRDNDEVEGFNTRWDNDDNYGKWTTDYPSIPPSGKKRVSFKPIFGLCNQPKMIPLMYAPLCFEFELCNSSLDPIISGFAGCPIFTPDNTSSSWKIEDVRVICDVCTLDSALQNSYSEHVLQGKSTPHQLFVVRNSVSNFNFK